MVAPSNSELVPEDQGGENGIVLMRCGVL